MKERNRTKFTILGMLAISPASGYEIKKRIQTSTNHFWSESDGQIYPALAQCVKEGLASSKEVNAKNTHRAKKVYSITALGKKTLKIWLKKEPQATLNRNELLLKLFFGNNTDVSDNIHHLMHYQKTLEKELLSYEKIHQQLITQHKDSVHLKYWLITLDYGLKMTQAELAWCKGSLSYFR